VPTRPIPIAKVHLTAEEIEAVARVLTSGRLIQGEIVERFERSFAAYVGARYAIATSSGSAALHLAYLALIRPGDEVLVPAFTHIATASMVSLAGGVPVFCDVDPRTFTLTPEEVKRRLTPRTKVIAPVHLFGNACDIEGITQVARDYGLKIVWDAAQAHGTRYRGRDVGSFDDVVCYSFYPTKNMTTGEGGMITTNDPALYEKCRLLRSHGQTQKYYHIALGLNYRMTEMAAAIGLEQLKKLDQFVRARRRNAEILTTGLSEISGVIPPFIPKDVEHSFHQYCILLDLEQFTCTRDQFVQALRQEGVEAAVHYPRPLHRQPVFADSKITLPVSEDLSKKILSLPVHPFLSGEDLTAIVQAVKRVAGRMRR